MTSWVIGVSFGRPDWEAGTNTRMPFTDTTTPPLFSSVTVPSTTVPASWRGLDVSPVLDGVHALLGELRRALDIVHADDYGLDRVADMHGVLKLDLAVFGELGGGDECGVFRAEVYADLGRGDSNNNAADLVPVIYGFQRILQHLIEALFGGCRFRLNGGCRLFGRLFNRLHRRLFDRGRLRVLLNHDLVAHLIQYLLDYPRRRGCSGSHAYGFHVPKDAGVELGGIFHKLRVGASLRA